MNPWGPLLGALAYNYWGRHKRGKSTICSTARGLADKRVLVPALTVGAVSLLVHVIDGYAD